MIFSRAATYLGFATAAVLGFFAAPVPPLCAIRLRPRHLTPKNQLPSAAAVLPSGLPRDSRGLLTPLGLLEPVLYALRCS